MCRMAMCRSVHSCWVLYFSMGTTEMIMRALLGLMMPLLPGAVSVPAGCCDSQVWAGGAMDHLQRHLQEAG
jgi:hypothetical protein